MTRVCAPIVRRGGCAYDAGLLADDVAGLIRGFGTRTGTSEQSAYVVGPARGRACTRGHVGRGYTLEAT